MGNFYNTTNEQGQILADFKGRANKQDSLVLDVFARNSDREFTSHDIGEILGQFPRSSIVRSMNTLEKNGRISKTHNKVIGKYGRPVYTYKLVR